MAGYKILFEAYWEFFSSSSHLLYAVIIHQSILYTGYPLFSVTGTRAPDPAMAVNT